MNDIRSTYVRQGAGNRSTLLYALAYASRGWALLPVQGKIPATDHGSRDATRDPDELRALWSREDVGGYGVALATGAPSGVWALDVDGEAGAESLGHLTERHGALPDTVTSRTGGRGWHLLFAMPEGRDVRNSAGKVGPSIDVRGTGGYIVLPPSRHPSGRSYQWMPGRGPSNLPVANAPAWLLDRVMKRAEKPRAPDHRRVFRELLGRPRSERARVLSALEAIPAGVPYSQWVRVGMALHDHAPGPEGLALWTAWSARAPDKYPGEARLRTHWRSFDAGAVTLGTLFHMAQSHGWRDPAMDRSDPKAVIGRFLSGGGS